MSVLSIENFGFDDGAEETEVLDVFSPLNNTRLATVPRSGYAQVDKAVAAAQKAFVDWSKKSVKERVQVMFRYRELLVRDKEILSDSICRESGKIPDEAIAEIDKSIELAEFACSIPQMIPNEVLTVSTGIQCNSEHLPLGVVASITPFNFPAMVPHWTILNAIVLGNCMILKPSEKVPVTANMIAHLLEEAGLPKGVFNIVHGDRQVAESICDHPGIAAVTFVGSTKVARQVYKRATGNLKRCLALGGAKNHLIVFPDAIEDMTAKNIVASMSGCAGQRCMAASAMIAIGPVDHIIAGICAEARKLIPGKNLGAVISAESKARIENYITQAEEAGAQVLVDGRNVTVEGNEDGFYLGPTVIDNVTPEMAIAKDEVFGPVICIMHTKNIEQAMEIENRNPYGNATSVFTQNGALARRVVESATSGMIGINVGVPVPREPFSFGGWKESKYGSGDITGKSSIGFWTQLRKTTVKWNPQSGADWMS
ncbi:MAG: CoA-acylating methylmalonate-semialdehyde dehydrogenase [Chitinophagaceae bacterium]|nr:MAG: CoA-acylating methylmalonate-semialdehyde dehydrogenase [Chitinophagaceae bacterium]